MATEYSLKLKAALDTSEVQQELNKLRTQTQAPMSRNGQSAGNLQNVNSLGAQLNRTNLLLAQLNTTLSKLNLTQRASTTAAGAGTRVIATQPMAAGHNMQVLPMGSFGGRTSSSAGIAGSIGQQIARFHQAKHVQRLLDNRAPLAATAILGSLFPKETEFTPQEVLVAQMRSGISPRNFSPAAVRNYLGVSKNPTRDEMRGLIGIFGASNRDFEKEFPDAAAARKMLQDQIAKDIAPFTKHNALFSRRGMRYGGLALGMLGREVLTGMADLYEARGDTQSAKWTRYSSNTANKTLQYGLGGYMLGGPTLGAIGAGVGAAASALEIVFKELAESAKQLAADLKSAAAEVKAGKLVDKALADQQTELQLRKTLKSGSISRIQDTFKSLSTDKAALLAGMAEVDAEGGLEKFNRKTQTLVQLRGTKGTQLQLSAEQYKLNEEEIARRKKVAEEYKEQADKLMKLNSTLEQFKDAIDTYKENLKKSLVEQGEADELAEIGAMANLQERIQLAKLGLSRYKDIEGDKNEMFYSSESGLQYRLDKAHKAALEAKQRYEDQLDQASSMPDSQLMAAKLAEAEESRAEWQHQQHRADVLDEALRNLKLGELSEVLGKLVAPDMTSTNSLANSGYMINRSDDAARLEAMNNYEQTQVELQRQIKDILETKSFAATAG